METDYASTRRPLDTEPEEAREPGACGRHHHKAQAGAEEACACGHHHHHGSGGVKGLVPVFLAAGSARM